MRSVLFVCKDFWPAQSASAHCTQSLAEELPPLGWTPSILTAHPRVHGHLDTTTQIDPALRERVFPVFALDNKKHLGVGGRYFAATDRPDRFATWQAGAAFQGPGLVKRLRPDAIVSVYPVASAHAIAARLARRAQVPHIAMFHDPMPPVIGEAAANSLMARIEAKTVAGAERLVFTTDRCRAVYEQAYPGVATGKGATVENAYSERLIEAARAMPKPPRDDRFFTILHAGHLYRDQRDPGALMRAVAARADARPVRLVFLGTADRDFRALAASLGLGERVVFAPPATHVETLAQMLYADALLLLQGAGFESQIPSKAYEYIAARRPVLALTPERSETWRLLQRFDWAVRADPENAGGIGSALDRVQTVSPDRAFDPSPYGGRAAAAAFARVLDETVRRVAE